VDIHINGYAGVDFSYPDMTEEQFIATCRTIRAAGCCAILPTMVTGPIEVFRRNLELMARVAERDELARFIVGFHLEGPFISPKPGAVGAHRPAYCVAPDIGLLEDFIRWSGGRLKLLTIAAELNGAVELTRAAVERGVKVAMSHQLAGREDILRLIDAGASLATHVGNGMPSTMNRHDNPLWPMLADDRLTASVIADGHHLPADMLKVICRAKKRERLIAISDASALAGLPPGRYTWLDREVDIHANGRISLAGTDYLACSSVRLLDCANHLLAIGAMDYDGVLAAALYNPARFAGLNLSDYAGEPLVEYDPDLKRFAPLASLAG
jgi:N-acetylglucosamine-6-phosphate deacetylase